VFEYCEHDFANLLDRMPRQWTISEVKCILIQLLKAVHHLHANFVIHRDLKLSNLLMNDQVCIQRMYLAAVPYSPC